LLSILASYYFFATKKYELSIFILLLGGFIKYIPWLLVVVPLYELLKNKKTFVARALTIVVVGLVFTLLGIIFYAPFGMPWDNVGALQKELISTRSVWFQMFVTYLLGLIPFFTPFIFRIFAAVIAVGILFLFLYKRKYLESYSLPITGVLLFATPWFMPWYVLWVYPLLALVVSLDLFVLLNLSLFLMQVSTPLIGSVLGAAGFAVYFIMLPNQRSK
jgi:hypothetical protein